MKLRLLTLVVASILVGGLYTNCQKSSVPPSKGRTPAQDEEDAVVHTFAPSGKVEIRESSLVEAPQVLAKARTNGRVFKSSGEATAVRAGTSLLIVLDRECASRQARGLSLKTLEETSTANLDELSVQAFNVDLKEPKLAAELSDEAETDPCVLHVANNSVLSVGLPAPDSQLVNISQLTNDPMSSTLSQLSFVKAFASWDTFFSPSRGINKDVVVAVVDTGIDYSHPDLKDNMWKSADGFYGKDIVSNDNDPFDGNEHGTHVAGLIGAVADNGIGITGVMGKHVKLMAVRVLGVDGSGRETDVVNGIRWAVDQGAEVINLSIEISGTSTAVRDVMNYASGKGVVVVVAAGNSNKQITTSSFVAPAGYCASTPGAISVASLDGKTGNVSGFSNYSSSFVLIGAPGSEDSTTALGVISTVPGNKYKRLEGTSMASPVVAGAAALVIGVLKSNGKAVSNTYVTNVLRATATASSNLNGKVAGNAALNLDRLARAMRWQYMIENDGGTESPF